MGRWDRSLGLFFYVLLIYISFFTLTLFALTPALAQDSFDPNSHLADVRVSGTSDLFSQLIKVNLTARASTPLSSIDLEAERNSILAMGTFAEVSLRIEARDGGPVLLVKVIENPKIGEIVVEGSSFPLAPFLDILAERKLLRVGATYNTIRAQEAIETIQRIYRETQEIAWPFNVPVRLSTEPIVSTSTSASTNTSTPLRLIYTIDEQTTYTQIRISGNTVLTPTQIKTTLGNSIPNTAEITIAEDGNVTISIPETSFNPEVYRFLQQSFSEIYNSKGYRGSGINTQKSSLENNTFNIALSELRIASISTTAIGVDQSELSLQAGDLFNYTQLLEDVNQLVVGRTTDIKLQTAFSTSGEVRIIFVPSTPASTGIIDTINIIGNTVFTNAELLELIKLTIGDTYTTINAEEDYRKIAQLYSKTGYNLLKPDVSYANGTYTLNIREVTIAGYTMTFKNQDIDDTGQHTPDRVLKRYLPKTGSVLNRNQVIQGLQTIGTLKLAEYESSTQSIIDSDNPQAVTLNLVLRPSESRSFDPELIFSSTDGIAGGISYIDNNVMGEAQRFSITAKTESSDSGLLFGGQIRYDIPWLDIDFLDFRETQTNLSFGIFSFASANNPIINAGSATINHPCVTEGTCASENKQVKIGESIRRDNGFSVSVGRNIAKHTKLSANMSSNLSSYLLEDVQTDGTCNILDDGNISNTESCFLSKEEAEQYLPADGFHNFLASNLVYDSRDASKFPTKGIRIDAEAGFGFGTDSGDTNTLDSTYAYPQFQAGFRTYTALTPKNNVLAFRVNAGTQLDVDNAPISRQFALGTTQSINTSVRGFSASSFSRSPNYLTSSGEFRHDFGLNIYGFDVPLAGIGFADLAFAGTTPETISDPYLSAGAGISLDTGVLPPVQVAYAFSNQHPTGYLSFRVGDLF